MLIIYLGGIISPELVHSTKAASQAANQFELGLLDSIYNKGEVHILSEKPSQAWPNGKCIYISRKVVNIENMEVIYFPYVNIQFVKELSIAREVYRVVKKYLKRVSSNEDVYIMTYNGDWAYSHPILKLKKHYNFKYVCLCVDPPLYAGTTKRKSFLWKMLYKIKRNAYMVAGSKCDKLVVLNKNCATELFKRKDFHVLDCGVNTNLIKVDDIIRKPANDGFIHLIFTGSLHEHSGILVLIDQMIEIGNPHFVLDIYGNGIYEDKVKHMTQNNEFIRYHGYLDAESITKVQCAADFLICPNIINHEINKYAFPSKLLEYMRTARPVIATKVSGISEDYFPFLTLYDGTSSELELIFGNILQSKQDFEEKAKKAKEFVLSNKNWNRQTDLLLNFLQTEEKSYE